MQSKVDGLFSQDSSTRLDSIREIKHLIIGNRTKKASFMILGVVPRLVSLLEDSSASPELICEAVVTLGSFAHGTEETVQAVITTRSLPLLTRGLLHPSPAVVSCCLRTLRTLYTSNHTPLHPEPIFQDLSISQKLVSLLSEPHPLAQSAAIVLAKACKSCDQQNLLCANGIIEPLTSNLLSPVAKLVQASLLCLSSLLHGNTSCAHLVASASCKGHPFISTVLRILSGSHGNQTKLEAAKCVVSLYQCGVVDSHSPTITLKVLPTLVRLTRSQVQDIALQTEAISTLAYLTEMEPALQELAADSDHLISSLVQYLSHPPDPSSDLVQTLHLHQFEWLSGSVLLLLGSLAGNKEEIRYKVTCEGQMVQCLTKALNTDSMELKVAALRCLLSLSRSTKLLRTCLFDHNCWRPLVAMLATDNAPCLQVATAVAANLLLPFSPSRECLIDGGVLISLANLLEHPDQVVRVNSLWALMSTAEGCDQEVKQQIVCTLTYSKLVRLLSPVTPVPLLIKAIGLLVNLTQDGSSDWLAVIEETNLLVAIVNLLESHSSTGAEGSGGVVEQCLCVLLNLSSCSEKSRDLLVHSDDLICTVSSILGSSDNVAVLMVAVDFMKNLIATDKEGHVHRQNCLKEYGVNYNLQKLEKKEHKRLRSHVLEAMDYFSS